MPALLSVVIGKGCVFEYLSALRALDTLNISSLASVEGLVEVERTLASTLSEPPAT